MRKAIVSAHIWKAEGKREIEILSIVHNDDMGMGIFDDIEQALVYNIDIGDSEDYYFIAIVESKFVRQVYPEYIDHDVEHNVKEVRSIDDLSV